MFAMSQETLGLLLRATLALGVSALVVEGLFRWFRPKSLRLQRLVWLIILVQGVIWFRVPIEVPSLAWLVGGPELVSVAPEPISLPEPTMEPVEALPALDMAVPPVVVEEAATTEVDWLAIVYGAWLAGVALLLAIGIAAYARFLFRVARSQPAEPDWSSQWTALLAARSVRRNIPLCVSKKLGPSLCWTPLGYRLIVPRKLWTRLTPAQREAILEHELAHFRRADLWKNLLVHLLALPHWFNPLAWRAVGQFAELAEWACDREVAGLDRATAVDYARTLLQVGVCESPVVPYAAGARGGSLAVRVRQLLTTPTLEESIMKRSVVVAVVVALIGLNAFRVQLVAQEPQGPLPGPPLGGTLQPTDVIPPVNPMAPTGHTRSPKAMPTVPSVAQLPQYIIEPPDVIQIELQKLVPIPPYKIATYDVLQIGATGTLIDHPVNNYYLVEAEGTINLGPVYGEVKVGGMTLKQAQEAVLTKLREVLAEPQVSVQLARATGMQPVTGSYLVGPDGTVNVRQYGLVHVSGKTVAEAVEDIEKRLGKFLKDPQVTVAVTATNSKVYYIIIQKNGRTDRIVSVPCTGNENVLDAIAKTEVPSGLADKQIWIVRGVKKLPVNLDSLAEGPNALSSTRLLPGDRLVIASPNQADILRARPGVAF